MTVLSLSLLMPRQNLRRKKQASPHKALLDAFDLSESKQRGGKFLYTGDGGGDQPERSVAPSIGNLWQYPRV